MSQPEESAIRFPGGVPGLVAVAALFVVALLLLWAAADVFLVLFAGILFAIMLRSCAEWICEWTPLPVGWALFLVVLLLFAVLLFGGFMVAPNIAEQVDQLWAQLTEFYATARERLQQFVWGRTLLEEVTPEKVAQAGPNVAKAVAGAAGATFGAVGSLVIVLFVGIYLAAEPRVYEGGFIRLLPMRDRRRAREVLAEAAHALRWWMVGKLVSMVVVGTLVTVGLLLLGMPLALTLGLLAALLEFIPYLGPLLAAVPAILVAFAEGPAMAFYVLIFYLGVQSVESYLVTPLVERRAVKLPPALTIGVQFLLGVLAGGIGIALASPLAAVGMVLTRMLYVEDILGDRAAREDRP